MTESKEIKTDPADPKRRLPLRHFHFAKRMVQACSALELETVQDGLDCSRETFIAVPGCGSKTHRAFRSQLQRFLAHPHAGVDYAEIEEFDTALQATNRSDCTVRALNRGGIDTLGKLLTTPPDELDLIRGVQRNDWQHIVQSHIERGCTPQALLPRHFLDCNLESLFVPDDARALLRSLEIDTLGDLLAHPGVARAMSDSGLTALRCELERIVAGGTDAWNDPHRDRGSRFRAFIDRLFADLDDASRELFERRAGIDRPTESRLRIATANDESVEDVERRERQIIEDLHSRFGETLGRLRREIEKQLDVFQGMLTVRHLEPGSLLRSALNATADHALPLRLAALLFPDDLFHHGSFVARMPPETFTKLLDALRRECRKSILPRGVDGICSAMIHRGFNVSVDLVVHVAESRLQRSLEIDPQHGERLTVRHVSMADKIQQLIEEHGKPIPLDVLLFDYRERYRRSNRAALRDAMRADGRFLEVRRNCWSMRVRHLDELEIARAESQRISRRIRRAGGRHRVADFIDGEGDSERRASILADLLRRDPLLRDLGRHEFCPRDQEHSEVMRHLLSDLRRAMGEIPVSRFLDNQTERRARLIATLLRRNRAFVSPAHDRIDLLTNYPYDADRIRRLCVVTDVYLGQQGGYGTLDQLIDEVNQAGLGGTFLTEHLLQDILRRHGSFELLPGGLVAQGSLGLAGWIQHKAREVIRSRGQALTSDQVLVEQPELAEFSPCLQKLLERDPLLQSQDGRSFCVA